MSDNKKRQLKTFPGLKPEQFMHPWDIKATDGLASVPGLDKVVGKVMEYGFERVFERVSALGRGFVRLVQHARVLE